MSLEEIKKRQMILKSEQIDQEAISAQLGHILSKMEFLKIEIEEIHTVVRNMDECDKLKIENNLKPQITSLIQSLTLLFK